MEALIVIISLTFIIILLFLIVYIVYTKTRKQRAIQKVLSYFNNLAKTRKITNYKLNYQTNMPYDILFETLTSVYYIKIIYNYGASEISINNPYKWEVRKSINDNNNRYISNLGYFIDFKVKETKKTCKKLFIIYPNARVIVRYINECELKFVYPDNEIKGYNVVTYQNLLMDDKIIEGR